jgi:hypothetical protein
MTQTETFEAEQVFLAVFGYFRTYIITPATKQKQQSRLKSEKVDCFSTKFRFLHTD